MPPLPRLRIAALSDLARRIALETPETARRQMERAEALCAEIAEPVGRTYPEDWVVERITGVRPATDAPAMLVGEALLGDLCALIERLSVAAAEQARSASEGVFPADSNSPAWLDATALCTRWRISRKTLDRYRRRGLPARRVISPKGRHRLVFNLVALEAFERRHAGLLADAGAFSRIDPALEARILRRAQRYRARFGWSLNQAAARLAQHFGRSHEGVRQLLRRHNAAGGDGGGGVGVPVFDEPGPLTDRQQRLADRSFQRGVEVEPIAARLRKSKASIYRALARQRALRLRTLLANSSLSPAHTEKPTPTHSITLLPASQAIRTGLGRPAPSTLAALLAAAAATPPPVAAAERARTAAAIHLRATALQRIGGGGGVGILSRPSPSATAMDEIETMLRWASRLKAELVRLQLPLLLKTIHAGLGREITELPRATALAVLSASLDALFDAVGRFDPAKGGRLAAPCGLALTRTVSHFARRAGTNDPSASGKNAARPRAMPRLDPASVPLDDWTRRVDPWQAWLEPDPRIRTALPALPEALRILLERRQGWDGGPPHTLAELAAQLDTTRAHAARLEHRAIREALHAARSKSPP